MALFAAASTRPPGLSVSFPHNGLEAFALGVAAWEAKHHASPQQGGTLSCCEGCFFRCLFMCGLLCMNSQTQHSWHLYSQCKCCPPSITQCFIDWRTEILEVVLLVPCSWWITEEACALLQDSQCTCPWRIQLTLQAVLGTAGLWYLCTVLGDTLVVSSLLPCCLVEYTRCWCACRESPHRLVMLGELGEVALEVFCCGHFRTLTVFLLSQSLGTWGTSYHMLHLRNILAGLVTSLGMSARNAGSQFML